MRKAKSIRFPHAYQIREMLGLNKGKLPDNQEAQTFELKGLRFVLHPKSYYAGIVEAARPHRLNVECPECGQWMSVGRFNQHQGVHPRETLSELSREWLESGR